MCTSLKTRTMARLTRRVPLVEQELPTLPEHLNSPRFTVRFVLLDVSFYIFCRSLFVLFLLAIALSVLRFTDSAYPFGIFKLFLETRTKARRTEHFHSFVKNTQTLCSKTLHNVVFILHIKA
jgi:hypothetical protein